MTYLVGYSPFKDDECALELACQLARTEGRTVDVLTVVPAGWKTAVAGDSDRDFEEWARSEGEACAAHAAERLAQHPDVAGASHWVSARSVPWALMEKAEEIGARCIVVGSGVNGLLGRVTVTSKADRLLHSSHIPVAVAPRGYHADEHARVARMTVGFRDDDTAWTLLDQVSALARQVGTSLRVVTFNIRHKTMVTNSVSGAEEMVFTAAHRQARRWLDEALDHLHDQGFTDDEVTTELIDGRSWTEAIDSLEWKDTDVLVIGSSVTHRLASVFLGSSATKILRKSPVPVIVVP